MLARHCRAKTEEDRVTQIAVPLWGLPLRHDGRGIRAAPSAAEHRITVAVAIIRDCRLDVV